MGVYVYRNCVSKERYNALVKWRLELSRGKEEYFLVHFNNLHILFTALSVILSAYHLYTNNWIASNFTALAFSFNAISFLKLDTFFTGMILLSGLFFYDIYWVFYSSKTFGQSVMVGFKLFFEPFV
jgi:minor histocompatibility antigen H13